MKIYKKALALTTAAAVGATSLQAGWVDDFGGSGNFSNVTPGGHYNMGGKHIFTSPSVYYRFGPSAINFEPIYHISPPDFEASCSGFNLKGLFVSILDLGRISKMIKSAGMSLAWGVVVGLVYSLPGIFSSFKMLNTWAKKIMELMQNSCQIGQRLGRQIAEDKGFDKDIEGVKSTFGGWISNLLPKDAQSATEDPEGTVNKSFLGSAYETLMTGGEGLFKDSEDINPTPEELMETHRALISTAYTHTPASQYLRSLVNTSLAIGNTSSVKEFLKKDGVGETSLGFKEYTISLNGDTSIDKRLSSFGIVSADIKRNQFLNFFKAVMLSNLVPKNVCDPTALARGVEALNGVVKQTRDGEELTAAQKTTVSDMIAGKDGSFSLSGVSAAAFDTTPATYFGMYVGYLMLGVPEGDGETLTQMNEALKSWRSLKYLVISAKAGKTTDESISFISEATNSEQDLLFGSADNAVTEALPKESSSSFREQTRKFVEDIVYNNKTPQSAANDAGIPLLTSASLDSIRILKQTPKEDRQPIIEGLIDLNVCTFGIAIVDSVSKSKMFAPDRPNYFVVSGENVNSAKLSTPKKPSESKENQIMISKAMKAFTEGVTYSVLSQMSFASIAGISDKPKDSGDLKLSCAKIKKEVETLIKTQDTVNKARAASLSSN